MYLNETSEVQIIGHGLHTNFIYLVETRNCRYCKLVYKRCNAGVAPRVKQHLMRTWIDDVSCWDPSDWNIAYPSSPETLLDPVRYSGILSCIIFNAIACLIVKKQAWLCPLIIFSILGTIHFFSINALLESTLCFNCYLFYFLLPPPQSMRYCMQNNC